GLTGTPGPLGGAPGKLARALSAEGIAIETSIAPDAAGAPATHLVSAFASASRPSSTGGAYIEIAIVGHAADAERLIARGAGTVIVVGVGPRTPLLIGALGAPGLLDHGVAERPGVVTPYDLAATISRAAGEKPVPGGRALQVLPSSDPLRQIDALRARFLRDQGFGLGLTGVTAGLAMFGAVFAVLFAVLK